VIRCGKHKIPMTLEVVNMDDNDLVIGIDRMYDLGIYLVGVPITWPLTGEQEKDKKKERTEKALSTGKRQLPSGIPPSGIAPEWEQVIADNKALPLDSRCKLDGAELEIDTGDARPVYIRPRPIPQA
jgi:hypothetical protein